MGVIGGFVGFYSYRSINNLFHNRFWAAFIAGWISLFIPAIVCAVELAVAGTFPLAPGLISMGIYHAVIGIIEGGATAFALSLIIHARPDIIGGDTEKKVHKSKDIVIAGGIAIALCIAILAPYYASTYPDGLESTFQTLTGTQNTDIIPANETSSQSAQAAVTDETVPWQAPLIDYTIPGLDKPGEVLAIVFGVVILFALGFGVSRFITKKQ